MQPAPIPETHWDLFDGAACVALTTVMPDGQPQTTPIWCNREGDYVAFNTMRGFRKERNLRINPRATLLLYDPRAPQRHIEIRGIVVAMMEEGALAHLDQLTRLYMRRPDVRFFGDSVAAELQAAYTPIKVTLAPTYVRVEG